MASVAATSTTELDDARRLFWRTFIGTFVVKLVIAAAFPFLGDEAYFVVWGQHPDYGYYDHGAMTGWWLAVMLWFGQTALLMRLPAVLTSQLIGWLLLRTLRPQDPAKAALVAALYLVSPINLLNVFTTTDTPLLFFSMVAALCAFRAHRRGSAFDWFLAGLALGAAFLSKYFAVLLGLSLGVLLLCFSGRPRIGHLLILLLGVVPGVAINVAWNYEHCWVNVLFNVLTRHEKSGFSVTTMATYVAMIGVMFGPGVIWFLVRRAASAGRLSWREAWTALRSTHLHVFALGVIVPLGVFVLVSFVHSIGLHWLLSFVPLAFPALLACFHANGLRRMIRPTLIYASVPLVVMLAAPLIPLEWFRGHKSYFSIVLGADPDSVLRALTPYRGDYRLTTPSYSKSAMLGFFAREHVPVLGKGSYHGRQDDLITDFREFDGDDLMVVAGDPVDFAEHPAWFADTEVRELGARGAKVFVLLGRGFRYEAYRAQAIQFAVDRYYRMPPWLARFAAPCFFCERYTTHPATVP